MSLLSAADLLAVAIFQIMQVKVSVSAGAVTQIAMMVVSIAYMPGAGIALAGTTLVGQSIGANDPDKALRIGTRVIFLSALFMGGMGLLLAIAGPWIIPQFSAENDPHAPLLVTSGVQVLWLAALYQFFDGLYLGSSFCLRGAGDTTVPAGLVLLLSWGLFLPLADSLTFPAGEGWLTAMPKFGWGVVGGWSAMVIYVMLLGCVLFWRWRSNAWKCVRL